MNPPTMITSHTFHFTRDGVRSILKGKSLRWLNACAVALLVITSLFGASSAWAQQYSYSTIAGTPGLAGAANTLGSLDGPYQLARDSSGNIYVADISAHVIRKITPGRVVSTYSGAVGVAGTVNGTSGTGGTARFNGPIGIAIDSSNNIYVAEYYGQTIRKIDTGGNVTTLAGTAGVTGTTDGTGAAARFASPWSLTVDGGGNVYVCDFSNHTIRKVTSAGVVTTVAGLGGFFGSTDGTGAAARFYNPIGIALDAGGNLIVSEYTNSTVRKVTPGGVVTTLCGLALSVGSTDGKGSAARFSSPYSVAVDGASNTIFVADTSGQTIRAINDGTVRTIAGLAGAFGAVDGTGSNARLNNPTGIITDGTSNTLLVTEVGNADIRRVSYDGVCTTWAGTTGVSGSTDSAPTTFSGPSGVARDNSGNFYVTDWTSGLVRKVTPNGVIITIASGLLNPYGIDVDAAGNVYVAEQGNHVIRKITSGGSLSTFAGQAATAGSTDGTGAAARFNTPFDVKLDVAGNLYVADRLNHTIRKITPAAVVTTYAGLAATSGSADGTGGAGGTARFSYPSAVALDSAGNVYVADTVNQTIRKITPALAVTTLAGTAGSSGSTDGTGAAARFNLGETGLIVDASGNLIVSDQNNNTLRKVTPAGVVTTLCGLPGFTGNTDGVGSAARFNYPLKMTLDPQGNVYVACYGGQTVRKVTPGGAVSTFLGSPGLGGSVNTTGVFNSPYGTAVDAAGNVYTADFGGHTIRKISPNGVVSTFAGATGTSGSTDGIGTAARFNSPAGVSIDANGNLYVADFGNHTIRRITSGGTVTTLAGTAGASGSANGTGAAARFSSPIDVSVNAGGTQLAVADYSNSLIRMVSVPGGTNGVVTTLAGSAGVSGSSDGTGAAARFNFPSGVALDASGNVFVGDQINNTIRKVTSGGVVTTLAGLAGASGNTDGSGSAARFNGPFGVDVDSLGNVFVCDRNNRLMRKVTSAGVVTTIGGSGVVANVDGVGMSAAFQAPAGVAVSGAGDLYIADNSHVIRKGTRYGTKARLVTPANGSALPAPVTVFGWEPGIGATNYALFIGSTPGGYDLYSGIEGTNLFRAVTLPADIKVYVTMYSFIGGAWQGDSYAFEPAPSQKAVLTSPAQGSTLASATLNLQWAAGLGASQYACWVGSAYGAYDLGAGAFAPGTNSATFTVPTDGGPVYVTLWSYINSVWQRNDYWFHTAALNAQRPARLTFPAVNGSTLAGTSTTFTWDVGAGATSYALWVGNAPDGYDIYSGLEGAGTSRNVILPIDGRKVYVTLHTLIAGVYQSNSYQFTCPTVASPAAQIATPASGTSLGSSSLALTWNAGTGATSYALWVGTTPGGYDLYSGLEGASLNKTVTGLPTDGRVIHVTLHSLINGVYQNNTAWYFAQNSGATQAARLTSHTSGASLPDAATTFTWNLGTGVTPNSYALWIGSTSGGYDLYNALETGTTRTVTLPTDGRKIYVTLHSLISGAYRSNSYGFTAPQITPVKAVLTSPLSGATFTGSNATLNWTAGTGVTSYHLFIGSTPGGYDLGSIPKGTATSHNLTGLPTDGRPLYITLYSLINGAYQSNSYIFNAWQTP